MRTTMKGNITMLEINRIATDNLKKTYYVQGLGNYLVCKFHDENHYVIYKGVDKNLLTKDKYKTLDDALQNLHDRMIDHSVYSDLCKDKYGTRSACTESDVEVFRYGTDQEIKKLMEAA